MTQWLLIDQPFIAYCVRLAKQQNKKNSQDKRKFLKTSETDHQWPDTPAYWMKTKKKQRRNALHETLGPNGPISLIWQNLNQYFELTRKEKKGGQPSPKEQNSRKDIQNS
eukprot:2060370-Ditylum_brightwellii.AAC.1